MKKNKSNSQQFSLLVCVLCVMLSVLFYLFVYKDMVNKTDALKQSNRELQTKVDNLKDYYDHQAEYEEATQEFKDAIRTSLNDFPELVLEEDAMMLAVKTMESADTIAYTALNLIEPTVIYTIPAEQIAPVNFTDDENDQFYNKEAIHLMDREIAYIAQCDYPSMKEAIKKIVKDTDKATIRNILFEINRDVNKLEGTIEMSYYFIPKYGKKYVPADMKEYQKGLELLFKLKEKVEEEQEEEEGK